MEIIQAKCEFGRLEPGDVFFDMETGDYFLKTQETLQFNAVAIIDGQQNHFEKEEPVKPLVARLMIYGERDSICNV